MSESHIMDPVPGT